MRILTIDDSKTIRDMLHLTLSNAGHQVTQANDGKEGIEAALAGSFDLVITDINMPFFSGLDVVRKLRANDNYKYTPILILSTEDSDSIKEEGRNSGATGWMIKPFHPEKLLKIITKVCGG